MLTWSLDCVGGQSCGSFLGSDACSALVRFSGVCTRVSGTCGLSNAKRPARAMRENVTHFIPNVEDVTCLGYYGLPVKERGYLSRPPGLLALAFCSYVVFTDIIDEMRADVEMYTQGNRDGGPRRTEVADWRSHSRSRAHHVPGSHHFKQYVPKCPHCPVSRSRFRNCALS